MRSVREIIILLGICLIAIVLIVLYFVGRFKYNDVLEKASYLSDYISSLDPGIYEYKNGVMYDSSGSVLDTSVYIDAEGRVGKSKYGHVIFNLKYNDKYICKSALGEISYSKNCDVKDVNVSMNKNNYQISFEIDEDVNGYKISDKDDFKGDFKKLKKNKDENFIINLDNVGTYYIWFKDKYGNLSEVIEYSAECLNSNDGEISYKNLYCPGSTVLIEEEKYIVLNDSKGIIDLMLEEPLDVKLSHCLSNSSYCYYNSDEDKQEYSWSKSYINSYLNSTYYINLSESLRDRIIERKICDNTSGTGGCDNDDGCGGFKKEIIDENNWTCESYADSKIRIISFDEYSFLIDNSNYRFKDNFFMINSSNESMKVQSVLENGDVYTKESVFEELLIRPVFSIKK